MDSNEFRKKIYDKYELHKKDCNDEFFNKYHYKNNKSFIFSKVAVLFIGIIMTVSVVYAGTIVYQYFTQKTAQTEYFQNMDEWFEINDQETYYKKINSYSEYLKYKEKWNNIVDMSDKDFEENFLIVVIASWRMPGITITDIHSDENTLYVELDKKVTEEEIEKKEYMVSAMVAKELDRENVSVQNIVKPIVSNKYKKLDELPLEYSINDALKDGCVVIDDVEIQEDGKDKLESFIKRKYRLYKNL